MKNLNEKLNELKRQKQIKKVSVSLKMDIEQKEYLSKLAKIAGLSLNQLICLFLYDYTNVPSKKYDNEHHKNQAKLPL